MPIGSVSGGSIAGSNPGSQMSQNSSPAAGGFGRMNSIGSGSAAGFGGHNFSDNGMHKCKEKYYDPSKYEQLSTDKKRAIIDKTKKKGKEPVLRKKSGFGSSEVELKDKAREAEIVKKLKTTAATHIVKKF